MNFAGKTVSVILNADGLEVLRLARLPVPEGSTITYTVSESEDMGLWLSAMREGRKHVILLRWEYILSIDITEQPGSPVGIQRLR